MWHDERCSLRNAFTLCNATTGIWKANHCRYKISGISEPIFGPRYICFKMDNVVEVFSDVGDFETARIQIHSNRS